MTIQELAADPRFDPEITGMDYLTDRKPWSAQAGWAFRRLARERTRCQVMNCGIPYAPAGVCGYCRALVKRLREAAQAVA